MSVRALLVVHREPIAAEALAAALGRHPALLPIGTASRPAEVEPYVGRTEAAVVDDRLPGAEAIAKSLRRGGARVVLIGEPGGHEDGAVRVPVDATLARLASALVPGAVPPAHTNGSLSRREQQVLGLAARGLVGKQIASHLGISPKTVEHHKTRIFRKLGVPNQAAAVALASSNGGIRGNGSIGWSPSST
ncbi:MAG TPA: LuxR C-terminal-related transcriptional regulator [Actinomycetota bacterium]